MSTTAHTLGRWQRLLPALTVGLLAAIAGPTVDASAAKPRHARTAAVRATTVRLAPAFPRFYNSTSPFNTPIGATPRIVPNSAAMVTKSLVAYKANANFANSDWWGVSIVKARVADPLRTVGLFSWG